MGLTTSIELTDQDLKELQTVTGCKAFSRSVSFHQIKRLYSRFSTLDKKHQGYLTREDFLRIPELAINPLCERIVDMFFSEAQNNRDEVPGVNFKTFATTLAVFKPMSRRNPIRNTKESKIKFIFDIYDTSNHGYITRDDLYNILRMLVGESLQQESLGTVVDHVYNDADINHDGKISLSEFAKLMENSGIEEKLSITFLK
ncbi:Calcineurin B ous protein 1 [Thelohanellus kitauei]|uniref:Calcineurin B ous protein 1 n=1 Tax=Thelohanellus kitauei TaxID=669202 RepID=A0A0C2N5Q4_THEKT|nr:Calcineurin B ous protein 1 [Thelohanellus kitauei]